MKAGHIAAVFLLVTAVVLLAGCTGPATEQGINKTVAVQPGVPVSGNITAGPGGDRFANLTRFVDNAAAYAREHGWDAALTEFNNPNGTFVSGELYVFAYDMNGTTLALPLQPELVGTNRKDLTDSNSVAIVARMIDLAKEGGGSLYYTYPNAADNFREEFKFSTVRPVDQDWFVGAGIYLPELSATFDETDRAGLIGRVGQAHEYAEIQGRDRAVADFNNLSGGFANGSRYIFAYDLNGTTLALPFQPELIGTNRLNYADDHGVKAVAWEISVAKQGGGFVYLDYFNPDDRTVGMKLCYVEPVDNSWLVGSGIYAGNP